MSRKFKLQKVLSLRLRMEEEARLRLMDSRRRKESARLRFGEIQQKREFTRKELESERTKGISAAGMIRYEESIFYYGGELDRISSEIAQIEEEITSRRKALTEAGRERRSLEKLKENIEFRNMRELAREESLALDEIALRIKGGYE